MALEYFCAFHSYREKTAALSDEQFGKLMRAALLYSETGEVTPLDPVTEMAFGFVRFDIDMQERRYREKCEKLRRNALSKSEQMPANADNCGETNTNTNTKANTKTETKTETKDMGEGASPPAPATGSGKKKSAFTPPTVEEVRAYCRERGSTVDAQAFVDYYTANGWKVGKNVMRDWEAAVRTWEGRDRAEARQTASMYQEINEVVLPF